MSELTGLQSILSKSHYKTQRKNKYSFSKSKRFPQLKQAYTIDFYDKPVLKDNRTCGFGYGSKYFFNDFSKSPSASQYSIPVEKTKGISFGVGRSKVISGDYLDSSIKSATKIGFSVGIYRFSIIQQSLLQLNLRRVLSAQWLKNLPQTHLLNLVSIRRPLNTILSYKKMEESTRKAIFPKSERFIKNIENSLIGPGQYDTSDLITSKRQNPQRNVFALAAKKSIADEAILRSASPGPVYYVS